jgi:hypothetical protein
VMIVRDSGADVRLDEVPDAIAEKRLAFRKVKIHVAAPACLLAQSGSKTG